MSWLTNMFVSFFIPGTLEQETKEKSIKEVPS